MNDSEMNEELDQEQEASLVFTDEEGNERRMTMIYTFDVEEQTYAVLIDSDHPESDGVILSVQTDEAGEWILENIEDDEEWQKVVGIYNQIAADQEE